jgi:hypothetical protein
VGDPAVEHLQAVAFQLRTQRYQQRQEVLLRWMRACRAGRFSAVVDEGLHGMRLHRRAHPGRKFLGV